MEVVIDAQRTERPPSIVYARAITWLVPTTTMRRIVGVRSAPIMLRGRV